MYRLHPEHKKRMASRARNSSQSLLNKLLFLGDFNVYWNTPTDSNRMKLIDILGSFRVKQHVSVSILLDLVIVTDSFGKATDEQDID